MPLLYGSVSGILPICQGVQPLPSRISLDKAPQGFCKSGGGRRGMFLPASFFVLPISFLLLPVSFLLLVAFWLFLVAFLLLPVSFLLLPVAFLFFHFLSAPACFLPAPACFLLASSCCLLASCLFSVAIDGSTFSPWQWHFLPAGPNLWFLPHLQTPNYAASGTWNTDIDLRSVSSPSIIRKESQRVRSFPY